MKREFNDSGLCVPERHFMADISAKIEPIIALIEKAKYFTINRPRQYGKTTLLFMIERALQKRKDFVAINISFEGIDSESYRNRTEFIAAFMAQLSEYARETEDAHLEELLKQHGNTDDFQKLGQFIADLTRGRRVVLLIDEVDKSANNQLFLDFLALLRSKYLKRAQGRGFTFQSVILAGVHDVKHLKIKIRPDEERKYNSPWNIAVDLDVDLSLQPVEIESMLRDFSVERGGGMDIAAVARRLFFHTSGYPFLVSRLCKIIDEKMKVGADWNVNHVDLAAAEILVERNTNFESLVKNLENNDELRALTERMLLGGESISFVFTDNAISLGTMYGVFREENRQCRIHNLIYAQIIYDHLSMKIYRERKIEGVSNYNFQDNFIQDDGSLNFERVMLKFQEFMKKEYNEKDEPFLEREGRLVFLAFLKPIINGCGHDFKEPQISEEKRLDIAVTFREQKFVVELKIWRGEEAHKRGLKQLSDYLDREGLTSGCLVIFDFRKTANRKGESERINEHGKNIFAVWV